MAGHAQLKFVMTELLEDTNSLDSAQIQSLHAVGRLLQTICFMELCTDILTFFIIILALCFFTQVIAAEGEHRASHSLKEAADVMAQSSAALQLRYLQTLNTISAEKNSTIIFPLPIDMIQGFMHRGGRSTNIT